MKTMDCIRSVAAALIVVALAAPIVEWRIRNHVSAVLDHREREELGEIKRRVFPMYKAMNIDFEADPKDKWEVLDGLFHLFDEQSLEAEGMEKERPGKTPV